MKQLLIYLLFLFSMPACIHAQQDSIDEPNIHVGLSMNQMLPAYSTLNFHMDDPGSGLHINDHLHFKGPLTSFGLTFGGEVSRFRHVYYTSICQFAVGGGSNYNFIECGLPGIGYELKFPKLYLRHERYRLGVNRLAANKHGRVSLRADINPDYFLFEYDLGRLESKNGNPVMVDGKNFSTSSSVDIRTQIVKLTPALSLNIKVRSITLRFLVQYNLQLYNSERMVQYRKSSSLQYHLNEKEFLTDDAGKPVSGIFKLQPFAYKLLVVF